MSECILIHIGQAGIQLGSSCWELFCLEHNIKPDGTMSSGKKPPISTNNASFRTFFNESNSGNMVPRCVFADLEPESINKIRNGQYRDLFDSDFMINDKEDSSSLFPLGCSLGSAFLPTLMDVIKRVAEDCESLQGFIIFHSTGGGTGTGLTAVLMQELHDVYQGKTILECAIYPSSRMTTSVVEPYNAILYTNATMEFTDCTFLFENDAISNICCKSLHIERPKFNHLNRLVSQVVSSLTAYLRFDGNMNVDLGLFRTTLCPYSRLHFPVVSYAPILHVNNVVHKHYTGSDVTKALFQPFSRMLNLEDYENEAYITSLIMYRGKITPREYTNTINKLKQELNFVDWCQSNFRIGVNYQPPTIFPGGELAQVDPAACMATTSTSIVKPLQRMNHMFDLMFKKSAFMHWYKYYGMDVDDFKTALNDMENLVQEYLEIENEANAKSDKTSEYEDEENRSTVRRRNKFRVENEFKDLVANLSLTNLYNPGEQNNQKYNIDDDSEKLRFVPNQGRYTFKSSERDMMQDPYILSDDDDDDWMDIPHASCYEQQLTTARNDNDERRTEREKHDRMDENKNKEKPQESQNLQNNIHPQDENIYMKVTLEDLSESDFSDEKPYGGIIQKQENYLGHSESKAKNEYYRVREAIDSFNIVANKSNSEWTQNRDNEEIILDEEKESIVEEESEIDEESKDLPDIDSYEASEEEETDSNTEKIRKPRKLYHNNRQKKYSRYTMFNIVESEFDEENIEKNTLKKNKKNIDEDEHDIDEEEWKHVPHASCYEPLKSNDAEQKQKNDHNDLNGNGLNDKKYPQQNIVEPESEEENDYYYVIADESSNEYSLNRDNEENTLDEDEGSIDQEENGLNEDGTSYEELLLMGTEGEGSVSNGNDNLSEQWTTARGNHESSDSEFNGIGENKYHTAPQKPRKM